MLTPAPLPGWLDLARALLGRPASDEELAAPWCPTGEAAGWLSRSAWSLALIASWRKRLAAGTQVTIWIPDFFCNESLHPVRAIGVRLIFYPLTDKMAPDMSACGNLLVEGAPDIFLLVHYFGQPTAATSPKEFCARTGAWLIEDAAHVLLPTRGVGADGDFVLYSPHKHLPIPEGAILVVRPGGPGRFGVGGMASFGAPGSWVDQLRDLQQQLGCSTAGSRIRSVVWLCKRAAQKLGLRRRQRPVTPYREQANITEVDGSRIVAPVHGGLARRLLTRLIADLGSIARYRQRHQLIWDTVLLADDGPGSAHVTTTERPSHREWTPYLAGYQVSAEHAEAIYLHWCGKGLPATTWPDLPPEVISNPSRHPIAWSMRHSRIYLPVHQTLKALDLSRCLPASKVVVAENKPRLEFVWDRATSSQWGGWLGQSGRSNLLQCWAYGAAKASTSPWHVTRAVVYCSGEPIAIVQVLQRRIAGMFLISRINRGPLYLKPVDAGEQSAVWNELACLGRLQRGRLLTVAPEARLTGPNLLQFAVQGFKQRSPVAWESVWMDLGLDLATLRKRLDGKWRNMLSFSERAALNLHIGRDHPSFEWMLARYRENMLDKQFQGPSIEFLRSLQSHLDLESRPIILRALIAGETVAAICLVPHGSAATYLLAWNSSMGRKLKANQYLLWQAMVYLKQSGLRWFDLGGVNEEQTPGIAAFKLGLNGERYESVGEYWRW